MKRAFCFMYCVVLAVLTGLIPACKSKPQPKAVTAAPVKKDTIVLPTCTDDNCYYHILRNYYDSLSKADSFEYQTNDEVFKEEGDSEHVFYTYLKRWYGPDNDNDTIGGPGPQGPESFVELSDWEMVVYKKNINVHYMRCLSDSFPMRYVSTKSIRHEEDNDFEFWSYIEDPVMLLSKPDGIVTDTMYKKQFLLKGPERFCRKGSPETMWYAYYVQVLYHNTLRWTLLKTSMATLEFDNVKGSYHKEFYTIYLGIRGDFDIRHLDF